MQRMTGRDSSPRAISNRPVSIFAEETTMASRTHAAQATAAAAAENTPVAAEPVAEAPVLDALLTQRKALDAQIKATRAAQPQPSKLDRLAAQQAADARNHWLPQKLAGRVLARVKAGQPQDEALTTVLAQVRAATEAFLARLAATAQADADADQDADSKAAEFTATGK